MGSVAIAQGGGSSKKLIGTFTASPSSPSSSGSSTLTTTTVNVSSYHARSTDNFLMTITKVKVESSTNTGSGWSSSQSGLNPGANYTFTAPTMSLNSSGTTLTIRGLAGGYKNTSQATGQGYTAVTDIKYTLTVNLYYVA